MRAKNDNWRWMVPLAFVTLFVVVAASKGIGLFDVSSKQEAETTPLLGASRRDGSIVRLLGNHPEPKISGDLFQAWQRGDVWVVAQRLPPLQDINVEKLMAEEAYRRYGQRATSSWQTVIVVNSETLQKAQTSEASLHTLEAVLLAAYEYSLRAEEIDTAVQ